MLNINCKVLLLAAWIHWPSIVIIYFAAFENNNIFKMNLVPNKRAKISPNSNLNHTLGVIRQRKTYLIFSFLSLFHFYLGNFSQFQNYSDHINCLAGRQVFYHVNRSKWTTKSFYIFIVFTLLNLSIVSKYNTIVIFYWSKFLVCYFYLAICKSVNFVLINFVPPF